MVSRRRWEELQGQMEHHMEVIKNLAAWMRSCRHHRHLQWSSPVVWEWRRSGPFRLACQPPGETNLDAAFHRTQPHSSDGSG